MLLVEGVKMQTYLFVTKPHYMPEEAEWDNVRWSCSKTTKAGDYALVYVTGEGIQYEWCAVTDAKPHPEWRFMCELEYVRTLAPPITLGEIRAAIPEDDWAPPYQNFRGLKSIRIPEDIARRICNLRPQRPRGSQGAGRRRRT
jgi:hypothetical protein